MPIEHHAATMHAVPFDHRVVAKHDLEAIQPDLFVVYDLCHDMFEDFWVVSEVIVVVATDDRDLPIQSGQCVDGDVDIFMERKVPDAEDSVVWADFGIPPFYHNLVHFQHIGTLPSIRTVFEDAPMEEVVVAGEPDV